MDVYNPTDRQAALATVRILAMIQGEHTNHERRETYLRAAIRVIRKRYTGDDRSEGFKTSLLAVDALLNDLLGQDTTHKEIKMLLDVPMRIMTAFADTSGATADGATDDDEIPF